MTRRRTDARRGGPYYPWPMVPRINAEEADLARAAAGRVVQTHARLVEYLRVGQTLAQVDLFVEQTLADLGCRSAFLGYRVARSPAFPSHACLSVNDCVVHGMAGSYTSPLKPGDILKIDIGVVHKGFIGDAAWTYALRERSDEAKRLMECGKESLRRGVRTLRPPNTFIEWARAVQGHVEHECGLHLVRGLGGHGYGRKLHMRPYVSNTLPVSATEWPDAHTPCFPGVLVAVEPMIAVGTGETIQADRGARGQDWPIHTADGSLSCHYEHDVLITEGDPEVLTAGLASMPDVVG